MIDPKTGAVSAGDVNVFPGMSERDFKALCAADSVRDVESWSEYTAYRLTLSGGIGATVLFNRGALVQLNLTLPLESDGLGWDGWSVEGERRRKAMHDEWLRSDLGVPPYVFAWGEVSSLVDVKTGDSSVLVRYHPPK